MSGFNRGEGERRGGGSARGAMVVHENMVSGREKSSTRCDEVMVRPLVLLIAKEARVCPLALRVLAPGQVEEFAEGMITRQPVRGLLNRLPLVVWDSLLLHRACRCAWPSVSHPVCRVGLQRLL